MGAVEELVRLVEQASGILVPERDHSRLTAFLAKRVRATGCADEGSYLRRLEIDQENPEWRVVLGAIAVKESYLFRASEQLRAVAETCIPELAARRPGRRLAVWSAGCARGEEAVTLAILLAEARELEGWEWQVLATDVDDDALVQARRGRYGGRSVAQVPPELLERYFVRAREGFAVDRGLLEHVAYRHLNLVRRPFDLPEPTFDLVFLRNVLIYFRPEWQRRVVAAVAEALAPDGYLFLGPSESLWALCDELVPLDLGNCFCYCRAESASESEEDRRAATTARPEPVMPPRDRRSTAIGSGGTSAAASRHELVAIAGEAFAGARYEQARELLAEASGRFPDDPALRALEGILAGEEGDDERAVSAYRAALYLDPSLYQVRYLLAVVLVRLGWEERARAELRTALESIGSPRARTLPGGSSFGLPGDEELERRCRLALEGAE